MKNVNEISDWVKGVVAVMEPVADFDHKADTVSMWRENTGSEKAFFRQRYNA